MWLDRRNGIASPPITSSISCDPATLSSQDKPKLAYLDSMRGIASWIVVIAHFVGAFFPFTVFGDPFVSQGWFEHWMARPPLAVVLSGHYAVCLFFILSGFVLSVGFLTRTPRPNDLLGAALKRPVRLGGMVLFTVTVGYGLMLAGLLGPGALGARATQHPWLATFWLETPAWSEFLSDVLLRLFSSSETYNPPMWTIHKELVGSYIVFGYVALSRQLTPHMRIAALAVLAAGTFRSLYVGFVIGMMFAEYTAQRGAGFGVPAVLVSLPRALTFNLQSCQRAARRAFPFAALTAGLLLGSHLHTQGIFSTVSVAAFAPPSELWSLLKRFGSGGAGMLGATLTFAAVWSSPVLQRSLDRPCLRFFGRISFAVYALHFLILGSLTPHVYRSLTAPLGHATAVVLAAVLSLTLLIPLAILTTRWIDHPSILLSQKGVRYLFGSLGNLRIKAIRAQRPLGANDGVVSETS